MLKKSNGISSEIKQSNKQLSETKNNTNFYKSQKEVTNFYNNYFKMINKAAYDSKNEKCLKTLTLKQMLQRLAKVLG